MTTGDTGPTPTGPTPSGSPDAALAAASRGLAEDNQAIACRQQRAQRRWLVINLLMNFVAIGVDRIALGDAFESALVIRLLILTPLMLAALALQHLSSDFRLRSLMTGIATIAFVATVSALGQLGTDAFANRYMMIAIFLLFTATMFAGLPWHDTKMVYVASVVLYGAMVVTSLRWTVIYLNVDLVFLCAVTGGLALRMRKRQDRQTSDIMAMQWINAERAIELQQANRRLALLSTIDALTGVYNRRYLDELIDRLAQSLVPVQSYGVLMIDVDHFKLLNDYGGHAEGDRCLQLIAMAIREGLRSTHDPVIRYGGEEFVVILADADRCEMLRVAERLRTIVVDLQLPHPGSVPGGVVTVSIGAYCATSAPLAGAVAQADAALYKAKQSGRNTVYATAPLFEPMRQQIRSLRDRDRRSSTDPCRS